MKRLGPFVVGLERRTRFRGPRWRVVSGWSPGVGYYHARCLPLLRWGKPSNAVEVFSGRPIIGGVLGRELVLIVGRRWSRGRYYEHVAGVSE